MESSSGVPGILSDRPVGPETRAALSGYDDLMPGPARILVVDDEARIAEVVQGYLEGQGHAVDRAATGEEPWPPPRVVGPTS